MTRAQRLMLLAAGVVVLLLVLGLVLQLRRPASTSGPGADAAVAGPPVPGAQPLAAKPPREGGTAVKRPPVARTQWPTDVPVGAARPPAGGFDKWTGDEFYRPDEVKEAARARGVSLDVFRESRRAFWLTQLTLDWGVLGEMGLSYGPDVRKSLAKLSSTTQDEVDKLLTAASKNEVGEAEARTRIRKLEDDYRKQFCEASGVTPESFDRFFEPSLVPEP